MGEKKHPFARRWDDKEIMEQYLDYQKRKPEIKGEMIKSAIKDIETAALTPKEKGEAMALLKEVAPEAISLEKKKKPAFV